MKRKGFTLIELVVAMAILFVLIYMGFASFSFVNTLSKSNQNREAVLENISTVLDQLTKELRQCETVQAEAGGTFDGVSLLKGDPKITSPPSSQTRECKDVLTDPSKYGNLAPGETYIFDSTKPPILRFYIDQDGTEHRICYTLGLPTGGGIKQEYWVDQHYQPCEILYSNEKFVSGSWTGTTNQPVTEQVITNFTVIRPLWSSKVIQIVIEVMVKDPSGNGVSKITRIAQITLRQ